MNKSDNRPKFIWLCVVLADILVILYIFAIEGSFGGLSSLAYILFAVMLYATILPVYISKTNNKHKNLFGYGIPLASLVPIPYFIWHSTICTGKLCGLGDLLLAWTLGISGVVFALFYTLGKFLAKWNVKIVLTFLAIQTLIIFILLLRIFIR